MNIKFTNFLLLLILLTPSFALACSCVDIKTFCETITFGDGEIWPDLIVYGEKTKDQDDGMELEVLSVIHGQEDRSTIFIYKGNGADCGENTGRFEIGDQFIFALTKSNFWDYDPDNYWLSICGVNFLKVEGANVVGSIAPGLNSVPLAEFPSSTSCGALNPVNPIDNNALVKLYPNPSSHSFFIEFAGDHKMEGSLKIYDAVGRFINQSRLEGEAGTKIFQDISHLSTGLYFIELEVLGRRQVVKMVVQKP